MLEADPGREHFNFFNWHFSGYDRKKCDAGLQHYIPCNLGEISDYYRRFIDPPDIMVDPDLPDGRATGTSTSAPATSGTERSHRARRSSSSRSNPALPYVHGIDNGLHASEVDYVIDGDGEPPPELPNPAPTDADRAVARLIASEIEDGACLQIGIGAMPNAVCSLLLDSGVRDLGVHTEMLTDGIIDLYQAGVVTGAEEDDASRQDRVQLRSRLEVAVRSDRRQPRHLVPAGRADEPAAPHHAERPDDGDQQHDPDGSPGPGRERVERSPPHQRHRRPAAVRPRRVRVEGRQVVHLHVVDLRAQRGVQEPGRAEPDARKHRPPLRAAT